MVHALTEYFLQHRDVVLPGLGQLKAVPKAARYNAGQQLMLPPQVTFQWIPAEDQSIDSPQPLMAYLSRKNHWTEEESFDAAKAFEQEVRAIIEHDGEWRWPGLGKLIPLNNQSIGFVPEPSFQQVFIPLTAVRALHTGRSHQMLVGDKATSTQHMQDTLTEEKLALQGGRWYIAALILGILALILIAIKTAGLV